MVTVFIATGFDGLFLASACNIVSHLQILQRNLREVKWSPDELAKLLNYHNEIFENCEKLFDLNRPFMLTQLIYSGSVYCVIGFSILVVSF